MAVTLAAAHIDENGHASGGRAGDQTGREVCFRNYYVHSKGWRVFRPKSSAAAEKIAQDAEWACNNSKIGYDQDQRESLYKVSEPFGFNCSKVKMACETDCSALVRVCCAYAGIMLPAFNTSNEAGVLLSSGEFVELFGSKYQTQDIYLRRGDILVTRTKGHTEIVVSNGSKSGAATVVSDPRVLKIGMEGSDVKSLQQKLIKAGFSCGKYGADGDFGDATEMAVRRFQTQQGLAVDGQAGPQTMAALDKVLEAQKEPDNPSYVEFDGNCYIREQPDIDSEIRGVALDGSKLIYAGKRDGKWLGVIYKDRLGWVSSKYGKLVTGK